MMRFFEILSSLSSGYDSEYMTEIPAT